MSRGFAWLPILAIAGVALMLGAAAYLYANPPRKILVAEQSATQASVHQHSQNTVSPVSSDQISTSIDETIGSQSSASLSASPLSGQVPLAVTFSKPFSQDKDAPIVDFGDGHQGTMSCSRTSCTIWHSYFVSGTFTARIINDNAQESAVITPSGGIAAALQNEVYIKNPTTLVVMNRGDDGRKVIYTATIDISHVSFVTHRYVVGGDVGTTTLSQWLARPEGVGQLGDPIYDGPGGAPGHYLFTGTMNSAGVFVATGITEYSQ